MPKPKLHVIIASTRPGRVGLPVATWFHACAERHGQFEVKLVDLAEVNLPFLDEPKHPRLGQYQHAHTKAWSATVAEADAYVLVTPEYNHSAPPALLNALDFVYSEWGYKPVAFVSYGGVAAGTRAVQMLRLTSIALRMVPLLDAVTIAGVGQLVDGGTFKATEAHDKSADAVLNELARWAVALKPMRGPA